MSTMKQLMIRILQCDRRTIKFNDERIEQFEDAINHTKGLNLFYEWDDIREKHRYTLVYTEKGSNNMLIFESKKKIDAICKLIIRTPAVYEPIRQIINDAVKKKYRKRSKEERLQEKREKRYAEKLALIEKMESTKCSMFSKYSGEALYNETMGY